MISLNFIGLYNDESNYIALLEDKSNKRIIPIILEDSHVVLNLIEKYVKQDIAKLEVSFGEFIIEDINIKLLPEENFYYTQMSVNNGTKKTYLEITIEKAIAIAIKSNCPIYIEEEDIMEYHNKYKLIGNNLSDDIINKLILISLDNEEYEIAAILRDKLI